MVAKRCFLVAALAVVAFGAVAYADSAKEESAMINLINEIDNEPRFPLFGGLAVERSNDYEVRAYGARSNEDLAERAVRYLASHTLKFSVPSEENTVEGESLAVFVVNESPGWDGFEKPESDEKYQSGQKIEF